MTLKGGQQETVVSDTVEIERPGPLGRGDGTPPQAIVLGMHRSGTSALTGLLDWLGFHAGPDDRLMGEYWEHQELHAIDEEILAVLGGSWDDALEIDPRRLGDAARARLLPRARALVRQLDSYGPWVVKDPRLCLLLPFWRELLERPLCILVYRDPLSVARSLAHRDGLPILVGIALWEHYNRAALAASQGLPRVLLGHRELLDDPMAVASRLARTLAESGGWRLDGLREISPAEARTLIDSSLKHHSFVPGEELDYLNTAQRELLQSLEDGTALLEPGRPLSAGAREILREHGRQSREAAAQRHAVVNVQAALAHSTLERTQALTAALQEIRAATAAAAARETAFTERIQRNEAVFAAYDKAVAVLEARLSSSEKERGHLEAELHRTQQAMAERDSLLAAVFASRSWRLGFGLTRLLGVLRGRREPTAVDRWKSMGGG